MAEESVQLESVRRLERPESAVLADLAATFEDLQTVLRCCEWLMDRAPKKPDTAELVDEVVIESVWTTALLSYGRCFSAHRQGAALVEADLTAAQPEGEVLEWHRVLMHLRDHYGDKTTNPRETFSVGVAQDAVGAAGGIAVTSVRQPLVDVLTVRQTGAIAYALSIKVDERIDAQQRVILDSLRTLSKDELDELEPMVVSEG